MNLKEIYERTCISTLTDAIIAKPEVTYPTESTEGLDEDDVEEAEEAEEEEELLLELTYPSIDKRQLIMELECLQRRVQTLQLYIKERNEQTTKQKKHKKNKDIAADEKSEDKAETCDDIKRFNLTTGCKICLVEKTQHKLQCQLNIALSCYQYIRDYVHELYETVCKQKHDIKQLKNAISELLIVKSCTGDLTVCKERYEYLLKKKSGKYESMHMLKSFRHQMPNDFKNYLTRIEHEAITAEFYLCIDQIYEFMLDISLYMTKRFPIMVWIQRRKLPRSQNFPVSDSDEKRTDSQLMRIFKKSIKKLIKQNKQNQ